MEKQISDILALNEKRLQQFAQEDKPIINWLSISTPEEIILAADMIPYRITGDTRSEFPKASSAMHRNVCPYVLSCYEEVLDGVHAFASGSVIVNVCDARRRLYDVWKYYDDSKFLYSLDFPKVVNSLTKGYLKSQFLGLCRALESRFSCKITDDSLKEAIDLCNESRRLLQQVYHLRKTGAISLPSSQAIQLVKTSMAGFRKEFNEKLSDLVRAVNDGVWQKEKYRILLTGSYFDHAEIADLVESYGAEIVCEDVSTGLKYFEGQVETEGDPLEALASYYLEKASCARMTDYGRNFRRVSALIDEYNIQAVIYFTLKFCDNNLFVYPFLKKQLNERGIPVFLIESERAIENREQVKTRIAAFLESQMGYV